MFNYQLKIVVVLSAFISEIYQQFESKIEDEEKNLAHLRELLLRYQKCICEEGTEALLNEIYSALEKSLQIKNIELSEAVKQTKYKVSVPFIT